MEIVPRCLLNSVKGIAIVAVQCTLLTGCRGSLTSPAGNVADAVPQVTDQTFQTEVLEASGPVLVDMWAPWCQPCVDMKPALRQARSRLLGELKIVEVNVQENRFVSEKYGIQQLPTLMVFVDGKVVKQSTGGRSLAGLLDFVQPFRP